MITQPKTPKSIRVITMPDFLAEEFREYCSHLYGIMKKERLFRFTKSHMEHCMAILVVYNMLLTGLSKSDRGICNRLWNAYVGSLNMYSAYRFSILYFTEEFCRRYYWSCKIINDIYKERD